MRCPPSAWKPTWVLLASPQAEPLNTNRSPTEPGCTLAGPLLQLVCTVLQVQHAVVELQDGSWMGMSEGTALSHDDVMSQNCWSYLPKPQRGEDLLVIEDTKLDPRSGPMLGKPQHRSRPACMCAHGGSTALHVVGLSNRA